MQNYVKRVVKGITWPTCKILRLPPYLRNGWS